MKISVIIPVYNKAPFLERCFESIPECGLAEVIVIDDGSTDGSSEICDRYKDRFIVVHQENAGVSAARNRGMELAIGDYITFLDADDTYRDNTFETMLHAIEKVPRENIIQFNHYRYYEATNHTAMKYANQEGFYRFDRLPMMWCMVWNKLYKRKFLEDHNIKFKLGMQYGEDEIFNLRCFFANLTLWHELQPTMTHRFDDKKSLCHTLDMKKLIGQDDALHELLEETKEPMFKVELLQLIAEHHSSKTYINAGWKENHE